MKHPFWIINLGLLSFIACSFVFIYFSVVKVPTRESIEPTKPPIRTDLKVAVNIQKIYENDLFGTYVKDLPKAHNLDLILPFPTPPVQQKIVAPKIIEPEFLDPLRITLMGIIVVGSNDTKNRAIIQDDATKQENTYKVGDIIQDAQLIRIFKNKVIILRLNGQQELLYLREQDAKSDTLYTTVNEWSDVVKKIDSSSYVVDPTTFAGHIENLTQFIDMINSTTAYQKGKSIGIRIGAVSPTSIATALGLQKGDIITMINNIPTETTEERLAIYKNITTLPVGHSIKVKIMRKNRDIMINYTLDTFTKNETNELDALKEKQKSAFSLHKNTTRNEQQHYAFSPTLNKIRKTDHQIIVENGKNSLHISS